MQNLRPGYTPEQLTGKLSVQHATPVLYRFMRVEYVDEFLASGRLMISSIPRCRKLEDLCRNDSHESLYEYEFEFVDRTINVQAQVGMNAFVLCSSLTPSAIHHREDSVCLELHHWEQLAVEIGEQLRKQGYAIAEIFAGACNYAIKSRSINMSGSSSTFLCDSGGVSDPKKMDEILGSIGREAFYTTKDIWFIREHEFRVLWLSNTKVPDEPVFVTIQNPEKFGCKVIALGETYEKA